MVSQKPYSEKFNMIDQDYYQTARDNEEVFRNILRDMKSKRSRRPMGAYIPKDLDTELPLDLIFKQYSEGQRMGKFTILNFSMPDEVTAMLAFEDVAPLSGVGAELEYIVKQNSSVEFKKNRSVWMS